MGREKSFLSRKKVNGKPFSFNEFVLLQFQLFLPFNAKNSVLKDHGGYILMDLNILFAC